MSQMTAIHGTPLGPVALGTMQFGGSADEAASRAMFDAARAAGITHFDTAHVYNEGRSETLLGHFMATCRDDIVVATKVGYSGGAGRASILESFEQSRQRLDTDLVDILYLHRFDPDTPLEESFEALASLQAKGQVRYLGVSNFAAWQVVKAQHVALGLGTRIDIIQPMHSLVKRQAEVELFPMARDLGLEIASYSPLGAGLLTGKYAKGGSGRLSEDKRYAARYAEPWMRETAEALTARAAELGVAPATLAVAWAMAHPARPKPIISARNVDQLRPSLAALDCEMTAELYAELSSLSRQPAPATDRLEEA